MGFEINIKLEAEKLKKDLDLLSKQTQRNLKTAIKQLSLNVYNEADRLASEKLITSREDYRNALKYQQLSDDTYIIYLDPQSASANAIEKGWEPFNMIKGLVNGPKSRVSKEGKRYNIIPFRQRPYSKEPTKQVVADMREAIQSIIKDKNIGKTVKEFNDKTITFFEGIEDPRLQGLTKITSPIEGKKAKHTQYFIWRVVSENSKIPSWNHPGYKGANIFNDLERYVQLNIDRILRTIL